VGHELSAVAMQATGMLNWGLLPRAVRDNTSQRFRNLHGSPTNRTWTRTSLSRAHTSADVAKSLVLNRRRVTYRSMRNMEVPT